MSDNVPFEAASDSPESTSGQLESPRGGNAGGTSVVRQTRFSFASDRNGADHVRGRKPRPPKLYRIGEIVEYSGMSRQTIHNYTTMGLLRETQWTSGGHRLYDESAFERLDMVAELKTQNKSLQDIREFFARYDQKRDEEDRSQ